MGLRIGTNVPSLAAQRQLGVSEKRTSHAIQALASGSRIVSAGDDAAGFAISEVLRGEGNSLQSAKYNADSAQGLIQVAEGGLSEQNNILVRLRELSMQAASDTVGDDEREFLNTEFGQLSQELDRIAKTTVYGKKKLLEGTGEKFEFQLGVHGTEDDIIRFSLDANTTSNTLGIAGLSVVDKSDARSNLDQIDAALSQVAKVRAGFGAIQSRLEIAGNNLDTQRLNVVAARSRIVDADVAHETSELVQGQIQQQLGIAVLAQANQNAGNVLKLL